MTADAGSAASVTPVRDSGRGRHVLMVFPILLAFGIAGYFVAESRINAQVENLISTRSVAVHTAVAGISRFLDSPIAKLESIRRERAVIPELDEPVSGMADLTRALYTLVSRNPSFHQVRWIDADGKERIRVQWAEGEIVITPPDELLDKSARYYFRETMQLELGEYYYSPLDLTVEHGEIERPFRPTIRIATPIADSYGNPAGILIINRDAYKVFEIIDSLAADHPLWLVNESGYWLRGPRPEDEWGFMLGHTTRLSTLAPAVWEAMRHADSGQQRQDERIWLWETARPVHEHLHVAAEPGDQLAGRSWKVVNQISLADLNEIRATVWSQEVPLILVGLLCFGLFQAVLMRAYATQRETQARLSASEQLRTAERLAQTAESRARHLVASNVNGMLNVDANGRITMTNPALDALFGYATGELIGQPVELLLPETLRSGHEVERDQYLQAPTGRRMGEGRELSGLHKNGHPLPVEVSLSPIEGIDLLEVTATVVDVSERRRVQHQLERYAARQKLLNEELQVKNEDMQELFYSVSHDLRSPLVTVHGYAGVLKQAVQDGDTAKAEDAIGRIQRSVSRLGDMIDDILRLNRARSDALELETIDTGQLIKEALEIMAGPIAKAGARVEVAQPLPELFADYPSIMQAMTNLIGNALKYGCPQPGMTVTISGDQDDDFSWICVADEGPGVARQFHNKVFQLFKQLDPRANGSGLGLTLVRKVAANHGGRAWVESEPGKGARFCFSIVKNDVNDQTDI